jgi:hypothetical protein
MRRIIPILVLSVSLAGCAAASETDQIATVADPPNTASQFYNSPGTGPVGERFLPHRAGQDLEKAIVTRNQFYISTGTGPVGERFLPDRTGQDLERVTVTRNQFYISTGTGPVGERFLAADGNDLTRALARN